MNTTIFRTISLLIAFTVFATGCTWVEVTEAGYKVEIIDAETAANCEKIGETRSEVLDNLGPIHRSDKKVQEELIALAKNAAGEMGGNAITPNGTPLVGVQEFLVYRCN